MKKRRSVQPASVRRGCRPALVILSLLLVGACSGGGKPDPDAQVMQHGINLLGAGDPAGAAALFRVVLARSPAHYGAHYQLAVALDQSGKPTDARPAWQEVNRLAEAARDSATLATVRARLAAPDTVSEALIQATMMSAGLYLMRKESDLAAAAAQFRAVLERNPAHYGATYQLAGTLDRMGQQATARPLWGRVLEMATTYKDDQTIQVARDRLK